MIRPLLLMVLPALFARPLPAAVLSYQSALRFLENGDSSYFQADAFADMEQQTGGAFQTSQFRDHTVGVRSEVSGSALKSLSVMKVTFQLTTGTAWSAAGRFSLLGESGFACVSLSNTAKLEVLLLNEIAGAPPSAAASRDWSARGYLEPGEYTLDAIIYTGGTGPMHQGALTMQFSIPEPWTGPLPALLWLFAGLRRRPMARPSHG